MMCRRPTLVLASRLLLLVASALVVLRAEARAQESLFALQFLGVSEETGDGRARGLGVLGVALDDRRTAVTQNPASLGRLQFMTLSVLGVAGVRSSRSAVSEDDVGVARFPQARFGLPIFGKVVLTAGFNGWRNLRGDFALGQRSIDGLAYTQRFERDGTLYTVPVGAAGAIGSRWSVGLTIDFLLGTVDEQWITEGDSILALVSRRRDEMTGRTLTLGVAGRPADWLQLGFAWSPQYSVDRNRRTTLEDLRLATGIGTLRDVSERSDVEFPQVVRAGATLRSLGGWLVSGDYLWREWQAYNGSLYDAEAVGNEWRYGLGVEWQPAGGRMSYRVGGSRQRWAQRVGGAEVDETTLHWGVGVDISASSGRLDFAIERAAIGDVARNGLEETTWRFVVGVSGQESWKRASPRTP